MAISATQIPARIKQIQLVDPLPLTLSTDHEKSAKYIEKWARNQLTFQYDECQS